MPLVSWRTPSLLLLALLLAATVAPARSAPEAVTLQLKWRHQLQFAGYYVALYKGFYRDEGLAVTLREGGPGIAPAQEVLAGRADFGVSGADLVYQWLHARPVVALASIFQHSPAALFTLRASGLVTPHDLVGKRVAMLVGGQPDPEMAAMFVNEGIPLDKLQMFESPEGVAALLNGEYDADYGYLSNEPFLYRHHGAEVNVIRPSSYGVDFYGDTLFTSVRELHDHPDRVAAFTRASRRGWAWALRHPDETIAMVVQHHSLNASEAHLRYEFEQIRELILPQIVKIGYMNPGRWQTIADTFVRLGLAEPGKTLDGFIYRPDEDQNRLVRLEWALGVTIVLALLVGLAAVILSLFNRRLRRKVADHTAALVKEVDRRRKAETALTRHNEALEEEVAARTRELEREVEQHRETVARLEEARHAAEVANRAKSEFLANISHEIRTPLNAITGFNQLLRQSSLDTRQQEQLERQYESARTLQGLISDVLDFSRIEAGRLELESVCFDLRQVLNNIREQAEHEADMKGLALRFDIDADMPDCLRGDPLRLGQVLNNLIGNAIKFTEKGGVTVHVGVEHATQTHCRLDFSVVDTGRGIDPRQLEQLFQPFVQSDASDTRRFGGTGLGLAISRDLLQAMGSTLHCDSKPGKGSRFSFSLELGVCVQSERASEPHLDTIEPLPELATAHILLVEDDATNQLVAKSLLEALGVGRVSVASSGMEAVEMVARERFDLIFMDLQMPGMDGFRTTGNIRTRFSGKLPIIAMTATVVTDTRQRCLAAGMDDYITKPIDVAVLRATLQRWIIDRDDNAASAAEVVRKLENLVKTIGADSARMLAEQAAANLTDNSNELLRLLRDGATESAAKVAHRMKGSIGVYGSTRLENLIRAIEKRDEETDLSPSEMIDQLTVEVDTVVAALDSAQQRLGA